MELEHRRWMYNKNYPNRRLLREEFIEGVAGFIAWAKTLNEFLIGEMIRCPCVKCKCLKFFKPEDIKDHLYKKGFMKDYYVWVFHGEIDVNFQKFISGESSRLVEKNFENPQFNKMVKGDFGMYAGVQSQPNVQHSPSYEAKRFYERLEEASQPLYEGSMHSKYSLAHRLVSIKSHWNIPRAAMDSFIGLMNELNPNKIDLPNDYYTAKKVFPKRGEVGGLDHFQRLIIAPDGTTGFFPSTLSMIAVRDSIIASYRDAWNTWREIPHVVRDQIWNCFRCRCAWHTQHDHQISSNFNKTAADLLKDTLWTAQRKGQKPSWMFEDVWARLNEKWASAELQKKSTQAKAARASDKEKLKGGAITYGEVFDEPPAKKKKDGTRIQGKPHAEGTYDRYEKGLAEWCESESASDDGSSTQSSPDDVASILGDMVGGIEKGRAYNLGSHHCLGRPVSK